MAIFIAFILFIIASFAWAALRGWMRGSAQTHDERAREAMKATLVSLNGGHAERPSWANNPKKMHAFIYGIRRLLDHTGISEEERKALFAEEGTHEGLMTYAAHMERKGASFIQQQLGAGEFAAQMAQAFQRRSASSNPIDLAAEKEAAGSEAEIDEALRKPIEKFLEMYDQLEGRRRGYYAAAVYFFYDGLVGAFGSLDGFIEASDDLQLRFVVKLKPTDEHMKRHTEDVAFIHKLARQFVSAVLLLMREERNVFFDEARPRPSPELANGIRRLVEIAEEGKSQES